jgi:hypothetical protein
VKGCFYFLQGQTQKSRKKKKEKKKQKKSHGPNNVNLEHVPYLDGRKAKKNLCLVCFQENEFLETIFPTFPCLVHKRKLVKGNSILVKGKQKPLC